MTTPVSDPYGILAHNADDDAFKALPYRACLNCRVEAFGPEDDLCVKCSRTQYVELDSAPWYGYDRIEKYGEPWDAFVATLDAEGTGCSKCGNGVAGYTYDTFPDEGHRMAQGWHYMALVIEDGKVIPLCEDCFVELNKCQDCCPVVGCASCGACSEHEKCIICHHDPCSCDYEYDSWKERDL